MKDRRPGKPHVRRNPPTPRVPRPIYNPNKAPADAPDPKAPPPTHWGDVADWYDQLVGEAGSEFHREVVLPGAIRLLAPQPGDAVLDLACGQGVLCRLLARQGVAATGIDAAQELIRAARDRNSQLKKSAVGSGQSAVEENASSPQSSFSPPTADGPLPTYLLADARELPANLPSDHFAAAACLLAIQNMNPVAPVFRGAARVLKPGGRLVLVMMHPCFRGPKQTHWGWDDREKVQYRRVDRYLTPRKEPIVTHPGKGKEYTWTFHRPIEAYVKPLRNAGLLIDAIEEWPSHKTSTSGPRAPAENVARKEIPMFLAIRAVKALAPDPAPIVEEE